MLDVCERSNSFAPGGLLSTSHPRCQLVQSICLTVALFASTVGGALCCDGCARGHQQDYVEMGVKKISPLINAAPKSVIVLDEIAGVSIRPSFVLGVSEGHQQSNSTVVSPNACTALGDSIYICDKLEHNIVVVDSVGRLIGGMPLSVRTGERFPEAFDITSNSAFLCVAFVNSTVGVFSHELEFVGSITANYVPLWNKIAATEKYIFIPSDFEDNEAIKVYEGNRPWRYIRGFMPKLIKKGNEPRHLTKEPISLNKVQIAVNASGHVAVGYSVLPFVFVFDSTLKQYATLEFRGKDVDNLKNVPPPYVAGIGPRMTTFLCSLFLLRNGSVVLITGTSVYHIQLDQGKYALKHRFDLRSNGVSGSTEHLQVLSACLWGNRLCVVSYSPSVLAAYHLPAAFF